MQKHNMQHCTRMAYVFKEGTTH